MDRIPFNIPPVTGAELDYLARVVDARRHSGNGEFTQRCHEWLTRLTGANEALLTHSCTSALEMAALLAEIEPGDEVIMPSFTFVSTANAVVLRGGVPVFVDIRRDTRNLDETLIEAAITKRTKAICAIHYAGISAEMDPIREIAQRHGLVVIEDAAQALLSTYHGRQAGSLSDLACFSFHETKNISSGEGGALVVNNARFAERAHIIWEKGTNRRAFHRGLVDKYRWVDIGSSFLPSEYTAAVLFAQLERAEQTCRERVEIWNRYHEAFRDLAAAEVIECPEVPPHCRHNGHLYYVVTRDAQTREGLNRALSDEQVATVTHYEPLHASPAGRRFARAHGTLPVTERTSACLLRLPLHSEMSADFADRVIERVHAHLSR
jgi:dTDP-4-amino-4,6-dideoxygalactose transaminase